MSPSTRRGSSAAGSGRRSPTKTPTKAAPLSAKAKGKRKVVNQDDPEEEEQQTESPTAKRHRSQRVSSASRVTRHALAEAQSGSGSSGSEESSGEEDAAGVTDKLLREAEALDGAEADDKRGFVRETSADAYFRAQARPAKTSNNRLSQRGGDEPWETFTPSSYLAALAAWEASPKGQEQVQLRERQVKKFEDRFPQWFAELSEGFSIIFHGVGSKRELLNRFAKTVLNLDGDVVVVNGFHLGSSISDVLDAIERVVSPPAGGAAAASSSKPRARANPSIEALEARAKQLAANYCRRDDFTPRAQRKRRPLYLVLHNMDGPVLRTTRAQAALSILAAQPGIRVITSLDHIHGNLIFSTAIAHARSDLLADRVSPLERRGYNFIYHHVPTFHPYTVETLLDGTMSRLFPPPLFPPTVGPSSAAAGGKRAGLATAKAVLHVLASLTSKAKALFKMLATRQVDAYSSIASAEQQSKLTEQLSGSATGDDGISLATPPVAVPWKVLLSAAKGAFLVSVETQMQAQLGEFRDHGIILSSAEPPEQMEGADAGVDDDDEGGTGEEWLWVAMERDALEDVIRRMDE